LFLSQRLKTNFIKCFRKFVKVVSLNWGKEMIVKGYMIKFLVKRKKRLAFRFLNVSPNHQKSFPPSPPPRGNS